MENNEIGLTDCLVKTLNAKLECLKDLADIIRCFDLDYLPTKNHWIIPEPPQPVTEDYYVEDNILYTGDDVVVSQVLITSKLIEEGVLQP